MDKSNKEALLFSLWYFIHEDRLPLVSVLKGIVQKNRTANIAFDVYMPESNLFEILDLYAQNLNPGFKFAYDNEHALNHFIANSGDRNKTVVPEGRLVNKMGYDVNEYYHYKVYFLAMLAYGSIYIRNICM
jgi:hypothetical protein